MIIKTINDYVSEVKKKYPNVPDSDIKKILKYGWSQYMSFNRMGCDVDIQTKDFSFLTGRIPIDRLKQYKLYQRKLSRKLRILFKKKHLQWDGYYYFCLNREKFKTQYLDNVKKIKSKNKGITFYDVTLYQLLDECKASNTYPKHLFRVPYIDSFGFKLRLREYTPAEVEYIGFMPAWKFYDLLIARKQYDILNGNYAKHV